jgi:hypothetical protein
MIKKNLKECVNCKKLKVIWKSHKGLKYCKYCWYKINKPKTKIQKVSTVKKELDIIYSKLRKQYLEEHPLCEAHLKGCKNYATDIHHIKGRGINYLKTETWIALCRNCHDYCHLNPKEAKKLKML